MLGNNEPIEGVELPDVFMAMLRELPWSSLRAYIQSNAQVLKRCTVGGHRLEPKGRKRFEKVLLKEAQKGDFPEGLTSSLFAYWYPVHEELHQKLEDYFHSDEYKEYREKNELDEDDYVLPDDKFDEFFQAKDIPKWRILLCFSPLKMTGGQADKVLGEAGGNEVLVKDNARLKEDLDRARSDSERLQNENRDLRARLDKTTSDAQEIREERKELRKEREALQVKFETAQTENRRLREELARQQEQLHSHKEAAVEEVAKESGKLERDNARLREELENWQRNYEKQRVQARELGEALAEANRKLATKKQALRQTEKEVAVVNRFADSILARVEWTEVSKQLKATPQIKRKFNSLIKKLNYEEDRSLSLGGTLEEFWSALQDEESKLVKAVAKSDVLEVQSGDVEQYWRQLTDVFEDVHISLEARTILLRVLQEIFYQTLEMDDLEEAKLPTA
jgi:hypothetical protein